MSPGLNVNGDLPRRWPPPSLFLGPRRTQRTQAVGIQCVFTSRPRRRCSQRLVTMYRLHLAGREHGEAQQLASPSYESGSRNHAGYHSTTYSRIWFQVLPSFWHVRVTTIARVQHLTPCLPSPQPLCDSPNSRPLNLFGRHFSTAIPRYCHLLLLRHSHLCPHTTRVGLIPNT